MRQQQRGMGLVCGAILSVSIQAWAQAPAVKMMVDQALQGFFHCRLSATLDLLEQAPTLPRAAVRIAEAKATLAPLYAAALDAAQGQPGTGARLRDFYAAWLAGLAGLMPVPGERDAVYQGRVAGIQARLTEMGERVLLEGW